MAETNDPNSGGSPEGASLLRTILRRGWIPLLCAALTGFIAFQVASSRDKAYDATSSVRVNGGSVDSGVIGLPGAAKPATQVIGETAAEMKQVRVAQRAVELLQLKPFVDPTTILDNMKVEPDPLSGLINVVFRGRTPAEAARVADIIARSYIDLRTAQDLQRIRTARRGLQRQYRVRVRNNLKIKNDGDDATEQPTETQGLVERIEQLQLAESIGPNSVELAKPAEIPTTSAGIASWQIALLATILGGVLGGALIALREQSDRRIRSRGQLERVLGVPVIASIPGGKLLRRRDTLDNLSPKQQEPFRLLFARLRNAAGSEGLDSVAITAAEDDGTTASVSWYLAAVAASAGTRVMLMESDHDRPSALDGVVPGNGSGAPAGVSDVLSGRRQLHEVVHSVAVDGSHAVDVVAPGARNGGVHLRGGDTIRRLLDGARRGHDLVLIETAALADADAVPFARHAQGAVVVCRSGAADANELRALRDALAGLGTPLLGVVAVGFPGRR